MKILVVEDYTDFRDMFSLMFEIEGFETRCACDGKEGFDLAQKEPPDLIDHLQKSVSDILSN